MAELNKLRFEIEKVTLEIVDLVGKRTELVRRIAKEKVKTGSPLLNREVEQHLRNQVAEKSKDLEIDPNFTLRLLNQLIMESIRTQERHVEQIEVPNAYTTLLKARELEQKGKEIIHLEVGEPDFGPPAPVIEALDIAVKQGKTCYTESAGIPELREKIAIQLSQRNDTTLASENILVTVGGRFALTLSIASRINLGEEVIIIDPSYPAYTDCVKTYGGRPVHIKSRLENNWNPDLGEIENCINKSTRMIILNNPCNPTGKTLSKSTLERIVELAVSNNLQIVSDEVYSNYVFSSKTSVLEFPQCNSIYIDSFSKTYGMTGFRLGFAVSDVQTIRRMTQLQNLHLTCVPEFIQYAGVRAIECETETLQYTKLVKKRLGIICRELEKTSLSFHRPDGGFYIFPRIDSDNLSGIEFSDKLLNERGVAVVPGVAYGLDFSRFFRISICQPEEQLVEATARIREVLR